MDKVRIGDICEITTGKYDVNEGSTDGEYPFFTCAAEPLKSNHYSFDGEAILLAGNGANVGLTLFYNGKFEAYQRTYVLQKFNAYPKYVFFYFKSFWKQQVSNKQYGSATNYIRLDNITDFKIPLPDLKTQQEIAHVLEQADKARQQRKVANALTDQFLQSSFLFFFGDPVKNEKGWETNVLEELGDWQSGGTPSRQVPKYFKGDIPWYSSGELNEMFVSKSDECITKDAIKSSSAKLLEPNTLLLGMYDTAALKSSITTNLSSCNQAIAASKLEFGKADIFYVYHAIQYGKEHFRSQQRGVRQKNLNLTMIRQIKLPIPPLSIQQQFAGIVTQAEQLRQKQRESERELENLFQGLLQRYFEEETISVKEIEETILSIAAEPEPNYGKVVSIIPPKKKGFAKYVLAGKIIKECRAKKECSYIKIQKLLHLSEYMLEEDLELNYYYQTAGPYDNKLMHNLANRLYEQKWFKGIKQQFAPMEKVNEIDKYFDKYFDSKKTTFNKLITLLGNAKESQCEIVSTLYAVWNDLIIQKISVSDNEIINRFYQWSDRKKQYKEEQLVNALKWIKENHLVPAGFGPLIKHKK